MSQFSQSSFAKGEIGEQLYGRVDTAAYQVALRTARNTIVHPAGGIMNRPGLYVLGPVKDHSYVPRIVEFRFKNIDTHILEFGENYLRITRNNAHITYPDQNITSISQGSHTTLTVPSHGFDNGLELFVTGVGGMTPLNGHRYLVGDATTNTFNLMDQVDGSYIDSSSFPAYTSGGTVAPIYNLGTPYLKEDLPLLKFTQNKDIVTINHPSYPTYELHRNGLTDWTLVKPTYAPSVAAPTGLTAAVVGSTGSTTYKYKATAIDAATGEESLSGLNATTKTISGITKANPAVVTCTSHGFAHGDEVEIDGVVGMTQVNGRRFLVSNQATNTFELNGLDNSTEDSTGYDAYSSGGTANQTFVTITNGATTPDNTISLTGAAGVRKYSFYKLSEGVWGYMGDGDPTGAGGTVTFEDKNIGPDLGTTPPTANNPFRLVGDYPGTSGYYEQRQVFGGSTNQQDTNIFSQTGNRLNFGKSSPTQEDDAITATLNSQRVNEVRWFVPGNDLIALTSDSEWRLNSNGNAAFAADTLTQKPQSSWGSANIRPIVVGNTILFVTPNQASIRSLGYSLQIDGYTGQDMMQLAPHIFEDYSLVDWTYARIPTPFIAGVRSDGKAPVLTFDQDNQVIAWGTWDTLGTIEAVASTRAQPTDRDETIYFVVRRFINGRNVRYIEYTSSRRFTDVRDCFFVDSGVTFDNPIPISDVNQANPCTITADDHGLSNGDMVDVSDIVWVSEFDEFDNETQPAQLNNGRFTVYNATTNTLQLKDLDGNVVSSAAFLPYVSGGNLRKADTTFFGLGHLEGATNVSVLADGNVIKNVTVYQGSFTLDRPASRVHAGLPFFSDIETLNIEAPGAGTIQDRQKKISSVTVRFSKSRGMWIGPTSTQLVEMKQREYEDMGEPTDLLTGDKQITLTPDWNSNGRLFIRQRDPLPLFVLAIIPDVSLSDVEISE